MRMAVRFIVLAGAIALAVLPASTGAWSPAEPDGLTVEIGVKMKTRDGVTRVADIYRPAGEGRLDYGLSSRDFAGP